MPSDPCSLAFDTSAAHCAAAVLRNGQIIAHIQEDMKRGQVARLMPLLQETLAQAGVDWADLTTIAVGIGPGNFTGTRIAISAARGLSLGLGIPAVGVSMFEVMAQGQNADLITLPAPRDTVYMQRPDGSAPVQVNPDDPGDFPGVAHVVGHGAERVAAALGCLGVERTLPPVAPAIAQIASRKSPGSRPAPLYVRPADAAPPSDPPPVILP